MLFDVSNYSDSVKCNAWKKKKAIQFHNLEQVKWDSIIPWIGTSEKMTIPLPTPVNTVLNWCCSVTGALWAALAQYQPITIILAMYAMTLAWVKYQSMKCYAGRQKHILLKIQVCPVAPQNTNTCILDLAKVGLPAQNCAWSGLAWWRKVCLCDGMYLWQFFICQGDMHMTDHIVSKII